MSKLPKGMKLYVNIRSIPAIIVALNYWAIVYGYSIVSFMSIMKGYRLRFQTAPFATEKGRCVAGMANARADAIWDRLLLVGRIVMQFVCWN